MQVCTLSLLATTLLASTAFAKRSRSSSDESDSSSIVEDYSINTCSRSKKDSAILVEGLRHTKSILKEVGNSIPITFFAEMSELERNGKLIDHIHREKLNRHVGLRLSHKFEKEMARLMKQEKTEKLTKVVQKLKKEFEKVTGERLKYVMMSWGRATDPITKIFEDEDVLPVAGAIDVGKKKDVREIIKKAIKKRSAGIIHFSTIHNSPYQLREIAKALKKGKKRVVTLRECVQPKKKAENVSNVKNNNNEELSEVEDGGFESEVESREAKGQKPQEQQPQKPQEQQPQKSQQTQNQQNQGNEIPRMEQARRNQNGGEVDENKDKEKKESEDKKKAEQEKKEADTKNQSDSSSASVSSVNSVLIISSLIAAVSAFLL